MTLRSFANLRPLHDHRSAVFGLLLIHAGLLAWSAYRHSPAGDEVAHLPAGISHWRFGRFDLYRVNPPLVRMVAALPVLCPNPDIDWSSYSTSPRARPEFSIGQELVRQHGERSLWWFTLARWSCIPFSLLGGYICYRWSTDLYGLESGLLALVLWCVSPNILAYGQMITPDMGAASIGAAACYLFWRWTRSLAWLDAIAAGFVLGLAELTKSTWIILFALSPLLWFVQRCRARDGRPLTKGGIQLCAVLLLAAYVVNLGYGFEGTFQRLGDYEFISTTLSGRGAMESTEGNRFRGTPLEAIPVPLPTNYVQGIDVAKRDFELGLPSYLRGEWKHGGWWYYYLYALAIKVPLGTFGLAACAAVVRFRNRRQMSKADSFSLLVPAIAVLALVSSQTGFNSHMRYLFPAFPFGVIYISSALQGFSVANHRWRAAVICVCLGWTAASSLCVYPHSLSYFNELAGGPANGGAHLLESNIDWGQDLVYLKEWLDRNPQASPLGLVCYTQIDPQSIGIEYWLPLTQRKQDIPVSDRGKQRSDVPGGLKPGWYAISVNYLHGMTRFPVSNGHGDRVFPFGPVYMRFLQLKPAGRIGYSINLYHLTAEDVSRLQLD